MNGTLTIGPPGVSTPASVAMRIARSPPSRPKWRETTASGMSTCMRPASISAGTRRGKMNLSIEKPFLAPRSGSPGSFTYATPASASASTTRTIVERSTSGRIAAPFARSAATHYGTRALYTRDDGAAPPQIPRGPVQPERHRGRRGRPARHRRAARRHRVERGDGAPHGRRARRRARPEGRGRPAVPARDGTHDPPAARARGPRRRHRRIFVRAPEPRPQGLDAGALRSLAGRGRRRRRRRRLPGGRHRPTAQPALPAGDRGDRPVAQVLARPRPGARHDRREGARGHGRRGRAGGLLGRHGARVPRDARDGPALPRVREARRDSRRERPDEPRDPRGASRDDTQHPHRLGRADLARTPGPGRARGLQGRGRRAARLQGPRPRRARRPLLDRADLRRRRGRRAQASRRVGVARHRQRAPLRRGPPARRAPAGPRGREPGDHRARDDRRHAAHRRRRRGPGARRARGGARPRRRPAGAAPPRQPPGPLGGAGRRRAPRTRAVAAVNRRISSALELDDLLRQISVLAAELTGTRFASFWIADEERRTLTLTSASASEMLEDFAPRVLTYDVGGVGWVARHRVPLVVGDASADDRVANPTWASRWGLHASAAYPVLAGSELLAVMALGHSEPLSFGAETRDIIDMFLAQAAVAIQNARLYREAQRRRDVAEVLARLARELTASLEVERIAALLARGILELVKVQRAAVLRYEPDDSTLRVIAVAGVASEAATDFVLRAGEGVAGRAIAERKIVMTPDILADPAIELSAELRERTAAHGFRGAAGIPLLTHERLIGALTLWLEPGRLLSPDELQALEALADQAALAFENARLYASARDSFARLRDTQMQLVHAAKMTALGQLVAGVAHELNNPLSVIVGYGQLLLARELPAAMKRPIEMVVSQADRMAKIVRNLLFVSRQRPPERAALDLNEVIERTLSLRLNQLTLSGISVERDLASGLPAIVGDPNQLEQVFLNLLLNSEQAIHDSKRGARIVVRTSTSEGGRAVKAQVIDDGPGIPGEVLAHVFEPFFTTKEVGTGAGLGLSVSYGIVQEHGGRLVVESRPGATVFTLELPVAPPAELPTAELAVEPPAIQGAGRLALVVEDEPSVRELIVTLLGQTGWRVEVASGGRAGLESVRRRRYDLVVSDVRMPEGGGEEFYRSAVALDGTLRGRFVFITADTANREAFFFLKEAQVPVIDKPFQPALFLDAVRRVTISLTPSTSRG